MQTELKKGLAMLAGGLTIMSLGVACAGPIPSVQVPFSAVTQTQQLIQLVQRVDMLSNDRDKLVSDVASLKLRVSDLEKQVLLLQTGKQDKVVTAVEVQPARTVTPAGSVSPWAVRIPNSGN